MNQPYRAYIKDCLHLNELPKAFLTVLSGNPSGDILTKSSSTFDCLEEIPEEVHEGDIFCLYAPSGQVVYQGVIKAKEDKEIQTDQLYALFDQDWFIHVKQESSLEHEIADIFNDFLEGKLGKIVTTLPEPNETTFNENWDYFVYHNDGDYYSQHRVNVYEEKISEESEETQTVYKMDELGMVQPGDISSIQDPLHVQKYGAFTVTYTDSQEVHLTTPEDLGDMRNIQDFIYSLYDSYGIVVEITIPYESGCNINIKTADYTGTVISKNTANIIEIDPKTETEEINKLVIFGSNGMYRKTYYATTNGIVETPTDTNRLPVINASYVYSDDELEDIKKEGLKEEMYNHEIAFGMIMNNNIYDFYDWKFGMPLEIHFKDQIYNSIYTGYEYSFDEGELPSYVEITCGIVRTKLTDKLNMEEKKVQASTSRSIHSGSSGGGGGSGGVSKDYVDEHLATKVDKVAGKGLSSADYTSAEKTKLAGIAAGATANTGTITGIKMNGASKGTSGVVDLGTVITAHQDISGKVDKVTGKGLSTNDYTTAEKNKLAGIAAGATANQGTITEIIMNSMTMGIEGSVNLGTVLTEHQDISGKVDKVSGKGLSTNDYTTTEKNKLAGIATGATKVTESTVSGWGFTKNTGTYSKPSGGIPKSDLASAVQTSLGKADTALQSHQDISGKQDKITPITAKTTQAIYPVTIDSQGHITSVGSAAVIPEGVAVDLQPSKTSNNAVANSAVSNNFVFNSGTQSYDISGTTFTVGSISFQIEEET